MKIWKKSKRGWNLFRSRYEFGFLAGLAKVKAKTFSGSGRVSRVRLAGLFGLAGLSWDRENPLTQAGLNIIPFSRVGSGRVGPS
jgi:hypothetical protein